ncbi:PI-PLC X domain-containing protein 1-like isoform X2 [Saccopteryx bilineata]|uniref:PI-PLC X domain-containing protein 1-like isoform X2 n=1 Tax=Saccopteryx bilineata TaxID=59482 RepID=UPI00338DB31A
MPMQTGCQRCAPGSGMCPCTICPSQVTAWGSQGSHDTMTYSLNKKSPISRTESPLLQFLAKALPCITRPVVLKWSVTQVLNVTEQLDAGVRYLDLRIAHMLEGSEKNLHFVHMMYTAVLVEDTLTEISEWLEKHPQEVVILACRNFEGMTDDLHEYLVACVRNIFGHMLCPRGEVPTLRQLWARGEQVLLSYDDEGTVRRHGELWPAIPYWWGNQVKPEKLIRYLEHMKSYGRPGRKWAAADEGGNWPVECGQQPGEDSEAVLWPRDHVGVLQHVHPVDRTGASLRGKSPHCILRERRDSSPWPYSRSCAALRWRSTFSCLAAATLGGEPAHATDSVTPQHPSASLSTTDSQPADLPLSLATDRGQATGLFILERASGIFRRQSC